MGMLTLMLDAGPAEGDIWVVTSSDDTCSGFQLIPGRVVMLSAGPNGELWGITRDHRVGRWDGANWEHVKGIMAKAVATSKDGLKVAAGGRGA